MDSSCVVSEPIQEAQYTLDQLHEIYKHNPNKLFDQKIKFYGWVRRVRVGDSGSLVFIDTYDGTKVGELKCIASQETYIGDKYADVANTDTYKALQFAQLSTISNLSPGCAILIEGTLVKSPEKATQQFEIQVSILRIIGGIDDPITYPIHKTTEKQLVSLRKLPFMRMRAQSVQSIFRIASKLEFAIHVFMDKNNVVKTDPNIICSSDCEGAGETFTIMPEKFFKDAEGKHVTANLTVSSQLFLEASVCAFSKVYTMQKSFRAEKSDTQKHLSEFLHLEAELCFCTLDQLMLFVEDLVKFAINYVHEKCSDDFNFLESKLAPIDIKPTRQLLNQICSKPFYRIKHSEAVTLIQSIVAEKMFLPDEESKMKRVKLDRLPRHGDDLGTEHEKLLVKYFGWISCTEEEREIKLKEQQEFGAFVFLTHFPHKIKSFYMKQSDNKTEECESFDLLGPRIQELVGGSMREENYEKLLCEINKRKMNVEPIKWFVDLRKSGSAPHGGFGLGFSRLAALVTGVPSVRDTVACPVYFEHLWY